MFFIFYRFCFLLRNCKGQDAVFVLRMDVILRNVFAYIKASAHAAGITLTPYIVVLLVFFVLVETLGSCYCQESFFKFDLYFIFFETGQIYVDLISGIRVILTSVFMRFLACLPYTSSLHSEMQEMRNRS